MTTTERRLLSTWVDRRSLLPLAVAIASIALVAYFDVQLNFPFVDEYARRWTIQHLADGHGLVLWGGSPNLVELVVALPLALAHLEPRYWRLAGLPFVGIAGVFAWLIARRLGADGFWASLAGALVVATPMSLSLATGMMTETAFIGLLLAAAWFALRWLDEGKSVPVVVLLALLCTLQRQQGAGLAIAVTVGLIMVRRRRAITRVDILGLAALWLVVLAAVVGVEAYHRIGPATPGSDVALSPLVVLVVATAALPITGAFILIPFLVALLGRSEQEDRPQGRLEMLPVMLAVWGLAFAAVAWVLLNAPMYVGYVWGAKGLGSAREPMKPDLLPLALFGAIEVLTILTVVVVLVWRRRAWRPAELGLRSSFLLILAATQFAAIYIHAQIEDRYYLPVLMPLIPVLAHIATRSSPRRWGVAWAGAMLVGGLALYIVGEQDYIAWQTARDQTARLAYSQAAADDVYAGYEETAVHLWIPAMDNLGRGLPGSLRPNPRLRVIAVGPDDPRPGFGYSSVSPGKVVIQVDDGG